jgi:hypothetical protein
MVREAQTLTAAANADMIEKCLKWYEYWCAVGNKRGVEASAGTLRAEIAKAKKMVASRKRATPRNNSRAF